MQSSPEGVVRLLANGLRPAFSVDPLFKYEVNLALRRVRERRMMVTQADYFTCAGCRQEDFPLAELAYCRWCGARVCTECALRWEDNRSKCTAEELKHNATMCCSRRGEEGEVYLPLAPALRGCHETYFTPTGPVN